MKISVDGGALANVRGYGNYTFSSSLLRSLGENDTRNQYSIYTFGKNGKDLVSKNFHYIHSVSPILWMSTQVSLSELVSKNDIFLALNQALPLYTPARSIGFSHGLSFKFFPQLYPDSQKKMDSQLYNLLCRSRHVVVSSKRIKEEIDSFYGKSFSIKILPYGIPQIFSLRSLRYKRKKIILYVGMSHSIKNIQGVIDAFTLFIQMSKTFLPFKLLLVGVSHKDLSNYRITKEVENHILLESHISQEQLIKYYNEASCLISASYYESFNFPILEALSQGTPVVAAESATIPELLPYVYVAKNNAQALAKSMELAVNEPKNISIKELQEKFNWKTYCKKLISLYES